MIRMIPNPTRLCRAVAPRAAMSSTRCPLATSVSSTPFGSSAQVEYMQSPFKYASGNGATFLLHLAPPGQPFNEATPGVPPSWLSHPARDGGGPGVGQQPPPPERARPPLPHPVLPPPPATVPSAPPPPAVPAGPGLYVEVFPQVTLRGMPSSDCLGVM